MIILRALADLLTLGLSERLLTAMAHKRARASLSLSPSVDPRVIVVGLGNPGQGYASTRHNAGQLLLKKLFPSDESAWRDCDGARVLSGELGDGFPALAVIPATFMNLSGHCVQKLCERFNINHSHLLVLHDDIDLPVGKCKMKIGGSTGGHRGLESIAQHLRSPDFCRLRIGVGRPANRADVPDYVLQTFTDTEMKALAPVFDRLAELAPTIPAALESDAARSTLLNAIVLRPKSAVVVVGPAPSNHSGVAPVAAREQSFGANSLAAALRGGADPAMRSAEDADVEDTCSQGQGRGDDAPAGLRLLDVIVKDDEKGHETDRDKSGGLEPPSTRQRSK